MHRTRELVSVIVRWRGKKNEEWGVEEVGLLTG
jgi:hypothetical protein